MNASIAALAAAIVSEMPTQEPTHESSAQKALLVLLSAHIALLTAALEVIPLRRLARELVVVAVCGNPHHLSNVLEAQSLTNSTTHTLGKAIAEWGYVDDLSSPEGEESSPEFMRFVYFIGHDPEPSSLPTPPLDYVGVDVFYATDRKPTGSLKTVFGPERNDTLSYGQATITIPRDHKMAKLEEPMWWKFEFRRDPKKHITIEKILPAAEQAFFDALALRAKDGEGDAFVFIHGYNVDFDEALRRTGQLAYDLNFEGAPILYSWPSNGVLVDYPSDANNAEWTRPHLRDFLENLADRTGVVHIIAHSMGNRALLYALDRLIEERKDTVFNEVVLTAPDVDADVFKEIAARIKPLSKRMTLYASDQDKAMGLSRRFNDLPRAGDTRNGAIVMPGVLETIDASAVDTSFSGHSYYGNNRLVMSDLFQVIRGISPSGRPGLQEAIAGGPLYWLFRK